jgi:hypothetical protein
MDCYSRATVGRWANEFTGRGIGRLESEALRTGLGLNIAGANFLLTNGLVSEMRCN